MFPYTYIIAFSLIKWKFFVDAIRDVLKTITTS